MRTRSSAGTSRCGVPAVCAQNSRAYGRPTILELTGRTALSAVLPGTRELSEVSAFGGTERGTGTGPGAICAGLCHDDHDLMTMDTNMEIPAGEFKAKCLQLMDRVARSREPIVITKRGKPVAKLVPPDEPEPRAPLFGYMAGTAEIRGDIVNMPHLEWSALTGEEDHLYGEVKSSASSSDASRTTSARRHK